MRAVGRLPVLAGAAAGVLAAIVLTLLLSSSYRADASIALVRQGRPPGDDPALARAAGAAAELFRSRAVAEPAVSNLRLKVTADDLLDRVSIESAAESSLVRVSVEASSRDEARRTAQELTELSTVLFNDRFGPETSATIWETASARSARVSPDPARNVAFGALLGALAGWALAGFGRRPALSLPQRPRRPAPKRAPAPVTEAPPRVPERDPSPQPKPEPPPEPEARPEPEPQPPTVVEAGNDWTLAGVERLLEEHGHQFPGNAEEFRLYADSFRDVAEPDGSLPPGVTVIVEDVFAGLIERARAVERRRGSSAGERGQDGDDVGGT